MFLNSSTIYCGISNITRAYNTPIPRIIYKCIVIYMYTYSIYYENDLRNKNKILPLFGILKSARVQKRKCMYSYKPFELYLMMDVFMKKLGRINKKATPETRWHENSQINARQILQAYKYTYTYNIYYVYVCRVCVYSNYLNSRFVGRFIGSRLSNQRK